MILIVFAVALGIILAPVLRVALKALGLLILIVLLLAFFHVGG
jgi:hypothetical protein